VERLLDGINAEAKTLDFFTDDDHHDLMAQVVGQRTAYDRVLGLIDKQREGG
jgi:hypothetical protein